jgi:C-terminal processing protease CtpA/Prc
MRTTAPERPARAAARCVRSRRAPALLLALCVLLLLLSALAACEAPRGTIGAVIAQDGETRRLFVRDVPPGLAADKAGIKPGDEILLIDGLDVRAMNAHQIHAALSGDVDATVKLTLTRGDQQVIRATLKRTEAKKLVKRLPMTDE